MFREHRWTARIGCTMDSEAARILHRAEKANRARASVSRGSAIWGGVSDHDEISSLDALQMSRLMDARSCLRVPVVETPTNFPCGPGSLAIPTAGLGTHISAERKEGTSHPEDMARSTTSLSVNFHPLGIVEGISSPIAWHAIFRIRAPRASGPMLAYRYGIP